MHKLFLTLTTIAACCAINVFFLTSSPKDVKAAETGSWRDVCCGASCTGGIDYCIGNGTYICCKP